MGLAEELQDETAEVLSSLIRFKTVNPPGNERECLEWLAGYLEDAGLTVELAGSEPERPCLVATLRGGDGPSLGYLSHVDRLRTSPNARAFLDGAGPAAAGAILGAAVPLLGAVHTTWQWFVLAGAAAALLARVPPLAVLVAGAIAGVATTLF